MNPSFFQFLKRSANIERINRNRCYFCYQLLKLSLLERPLVQHGFSNTYVVTKVKVGNFHSQLKSYKTVIYCNFGRHKDLSTLKSDIHLGLIKVHVNITLSGRYILMCISLKSIMV